MELDCYDTPQAERLLVSGLERHSDGSDARRLLATEAVAAGLFIVVGGSLAALGSSVRSFSSSAVVATVTVYVIAARVRFPVGSAWTAPTQLAFVPMLFVLPTPFVPLIVAAYSVADQLPQAIRGRLTLTRVLARVADSSYALGPALVLVAFDGQDFAWDRWPLLLAAFVAQIAFDAGVGLSRTWFAEHVPPSRQPQMLWLYATDAALSCVAVCIAASATTKPGLVLLALPLIGLLWLQARERQQRLDYTLALSTAYRGTAGLLGRVVEADDDYTGAHSRDVVDLSRATAAALGLDPGHRRAVEFVAMLHDVGKVNVPKEILNKPGKLDASEWEIMRRHTTDGEDMLNQVGGALGSIGPYVRASHEHYDGSGYPDGLVGERIPIPSRVVSVCDAYSAMTTDRPYRAAMPTRAALEELRRCAGTQFDPKVVSALERVVAA